MSLIYFYIENHKHLENEEFNFNTENIECKYSDHKLKIDLNNYVDIHGKNLRINAIVGENGSGKSTLLEALPFFCDSYKNTISYILVYKQSNAIRISSNFLLQKNIITSKEVKVEIDSKLTDIKKYTEETSIMISSEVINHFNIFNNDIDNRFLDARIEEYAKSFFSDENENYFNEIQLLHENDKPIFFNEEFKKELISNQHSLQLLFLFNSNWKCLENHITIPNKITIQIKKFTEFFQDFINENNYILGQSDSYIEDEELYVDNEGIPSEIEELTNNFDSDISLEEEFIYDYGNPVFEKNKNLKYKLKEYKLEQNDSIKFRIMETIFAYLIDKIITKDTNEYFKNKKEKFVYLMNLDESFDRGLLDRIIFTEEFILKHSSIDMENYSFKIEFSQIQKTIFKDYINTSANYITNYFSLSWEHDLSQGEMILLNILAHMYSHIKRHKEYSSTLFLLDESDIFLHPKWQKSIIKIIVDFIAANFNSHNIHILLTTHSPFILSDLYEKQIIYMNKGKKVSSSTNSFGANIHDLLSDSFFMGSNLLGEFSSQEIKKVLEFYNEFKEKEEVIFKYLNDKTSSSELEKKIKVIRKKLPNMFKIVNLIGEKYLNKILLEKLLYIEEKLDSNYLEDEISILEKRLNKLKKIQEKRDTHDQD